MNPVRYKWLSYGPYRITTGWRHGTAGRLNAALRALKSPGEQIRVEYDNGQAVIYTRRPWTAKDLASKSVDLGRTICAEDDQHDLMLRRIRQ